MKIICTQKDQEILVDDEDYDVLSQYPWHINSKGYAVRNVPHPTQKGVWIKELMHRRLMGLEFGDVRKVDHWNGNTTDNQRRNLRVCTNSQNLFNRGPNKNSKSGLKGVSFCNTHKYWVAEIWVDGKKTVIGRYHSPEEANKARQEASRELHGEFAHID